MMVLRVRLYGVLKRYELKISWNMVEIFRRKNIVIN